MIMTMMMTICVSCVLMGRGNGNGVDVPTRRMDLHSFACNAEVPSYEQNEKHNASSMTIVLGSIPNASFAISGVVFKGGSREICNGLRGRGKVVNNVEHRHVFVHLRSDASGRGVAISKGVVTHVSLLPFWFLTTFG